MKPIKIPTLAFIEDHDPGDEDSSERSMWTVRVSPYIKPGSHEFMFTRDQLYGVPPHRRKN
jgi:hypothetical protein